MLYAIKRKSRNGNGKKELYIFWQMVYGRKLGKRMEIERGHALSMNGPHSRVL